MGNAMIARMETISREITTRQNFIAEVYYSQIYARKSPLFRLNQLVGGGRFQGEGDVGGVAGGSELTCGELPNRRAASAVGR